MAAGPPYIKNVRNTAASEKLMANLELGKVRLIRGPTIVENARITRNPMLKVSTGNPASANATQTAPAEMVIPFAKFEWVSLFITGKRGGTSSGRARKVSRFYSP